MQQIKAEEEAAAASAEERRDATSSLFVETDNEGAVPAGVASHVSNSARFFSSRKGGDGEVVEGFEREPEHPLPILSTIPIPPAPTPIQIAIRQTVLTSGPYAGLLSAGKRPRDNPVNPFAPPKKQHRQSDARISS